MSEAKLSYAMLSTWLSETTFQGLFDREAGWQHIKKICSLLDKSPLSLSPSDGIGLELHYMGAKQVDISFLGNYSLLGVPGIQYPLFAQTWQSMVTKNSLQNVLDNHCIVEFDSTGSGYKLMGLFQRFTQKYFEQSELLKIINLYLESRQVELGRALLAEILSISLDRLMATCDVLGLPSFVGFLDRELMAVKLVIPVNADNLEAAVYFIRDYFAKSFPLRIYEINLVVVFLEKAVKNNCHPRISFDYDLEKACFLNRLAFEYTPSSIESEIGQDNEISGLIGSASSVFSDCIGQSQLLRSKLPYGQRRPSLNLVRQEILSVNHAHSKLILAGSSLTLKDYVMVRLLEQ
jgi:hypothetical protein